MNRLLVKFLENKKEYKHIDLYNNYMRVYAQANPSILYINNLYVNLRCINYITYISKSSKYTKHIDGWISNQHVNSVNYLAYIDNDKVQKEFKNINIKSNLSFKYSGLEDAILTYWNNSIYLCGTRCDIDKNKGLFCIYKLDEHFNICEETIVKDESVVGALEKHWSPIEDMPFTFVRWCNPTEIIQVEEKTGKVINVTSKEKSQLIKSRLRGNCQTVKYKDGYLSIVHNTKYYMNKNSVLVPSYKHYFIQYDNNFNIINISKPFSFETNDIEFCCGLQIKDNIVYISYSVYDSIPILIQFNESVLEDIFKFDDDYEDVNIEIIYDKGNDFLRENNFYGAAACYNRVFTDTTNKTLEYNSLMKFCISILAIKYNNVNVFSNEIISSFLDSLLELNDTSAEVYYLYSIFYGLMGEFDKKEFFRKQSNKYRFEYPEVKRYLKMW